MPDNPESDGLKLTEDEATALLGMCLTSPLRLDAISEKALKKLAEYCAIKSNHIDISPNARKIGKEFSSEQVKAGV